MGIKNTPYRTKDIKLTTEFIKVAQLMTCDKP